MSTKYKVIMAIVVSATLFAAGRYTAPIQTKVETKIVYTESKEKDTDKNKHKVTTVTETTRPDGTKTITSVTTEDSDTHSKQTDKIDENKTTVAETSRYSAPVTVLALGALKLTSPYEGIDIGVSVSRPILGPITVGAFGYKSGIVGLSLGLTF